MTKSAGKTRIVITVNNDLETDQRVHKVASTLVAANYDVLLVGHRKGSQQKFLDRNYPTKRFRLLFHKKFFFFVEYNIRLFFFLLFTNADIFLSNDTDTILPNLFVSKIRKKKLVFDAHEMYPEVPELAHRPRIKKIWTRIEDYAFPKLKYCCTVCDSIARIYNRRYGISMQVVRNIPFAERSTVPKFIDKKGKKLLLYQGAINTGRGLEWMIDAMPLLDECIFHIAGDGYMLDELQRGVQQKGLTDRVVFLGKIPFEELASYTTNADIGISLLAEQGLNYYYALPNRIFDFIRSEVPILATGFPEMRNIIETYGIGKCIDHYEPEYLSTVIRQMLATDKNTPSFDKANAELTWENESKVLLDMFDKH